MKGDVEEYHIMKKTDAYIATQQFVVSGYKNKDVWLGLSMTSCLNVGIFLLSLNPPSFNFSTCCTFLILGNSRNKNEMYADTLGIASQPCVSKILSRNNNVCKHKDIETEKLYVKQLAFYVYVRTGSRNCLRKQQMTGRLFTRLATPPADGYVAEVASSYTYGLFAAIAVGRNWRPFFFHRVISKQPNTYEGCIIV